MREKIIVFVLLFLFLFPVLVSGASVKIQWKPNTEPDLAGYIVYWGNDHRNYGAGASAGTSTTYEIKNLSTGTWYIAVSAIDTNGNESDYSYEVVKEIKMSPPEELEIIE